MTPTTPAGAASPGAAPAPALHESWSGWMLPVGYRPHSFGLCRGCRAQIIWATTPKGRRAPFDRDGTSHFATCPHAERFRK